LDRNNLDKINDLVIELSKKKIILVIAHRLAIMRRCDRVVVLNEGEIIATGTHNELIATCKYYQELFNRNVGNDRMPLQ
jgi:ABC-type multidrug transport system fused ATPase/permease subunit